VPAVELTLNVWVFLLVGLLLAFAGRVLVIFQIALLGALLGAVAAGALLDAALAGGLALPPDWPLGLVHLGALLIGAVVGWVLAGLLRRVAVFILGALVGAAALTQAAAIWPDLLPTGVAWLLGAVLGGILMLALEGPLLKVGTAILGGLLVASALATLLPPEQAGLAPLGGLAVAVVGALTQLGRN
jgi:hypothetical protein